MVGALEQRRQAPEHINTPPSHLDLETETIKAQTWLRPS